MQGIKISGVGISFAMAGPPDSPRRQKVGRRKTKEERRNMIESFVQKYKTSNKGEFPSLSLTHKEVGGSFYTVRQIMRELKQEHKSYDTLGTDLEVRSSERQTTHSVEPISIPAEISTYISSTSGGEENNHISQLEEDRNQDVLLHNKEQNIANNYVVGTCGINDQSAVKQEIQVVEKPLVTTAVSKPLGMQSLLGTTEGTLYGKEEKNSNKIIVLNECQKNENIHVPEIMGHAPKTKVVAAESVMESCSSSAENQMDYKFLEAQEQEFHPVYVKDNSAPITMYKNEPSPDIPSAYVFVEPYIHQVLTYAQQSRERTNYEQTALAERMQEFRRQIEQESQRSFSDVEASPSGDGIQAVGRSSHKMIEAVMQSTAKGKVQTIKQGYLLKRSSNLRGDWKRRFFVLDSRGMLYYYRKQWGKPVGAANQHSVQRAPHSSEHVTGLLGRLLSSQHGAPQDDSTVTHHTVNLLTSTIKVDAEQTDLRFCFRIISPLKNYTLQAENAIDRMDWIDKITAVIASLLNSQLPEQIGYSQRLPHSSVGSGHQGSVSESSSLSSSSDFDHSLPEESASLRSSVPSRHDYYVRGIQGYMTPEQQERPLETLRKVPGNSLCADCDCHDPDWASLNLGVLLCIECSGVHRNLGVHISKVRSLTLDVKVWEPSVISLFQSLGNMYANSIWEELLQNGNERHDVHSKVDNLEQETNYISITKPDPRDALSTKERYIQAKYVEKQLVFKEMFDPKLPSVAYRIWDAVQTNNKQMTYHLIVISDADVNTTYEQAKSNSFSHLSNSFMDPDMSQNSCSGNMQLPDSFTSSPSSVTDNNDLSEVEGGLQGCSLLHMACHTGDLGMLELLLQYGANLNVRDYYGRTPLHHCIFKGKNRFAKFLIRRGASPMILDGRGKTPLQRAMEMGAITDDELFLLLSEHNR